MFKGLALSVSASSLFATQYYLFTLIPNMSGMEIFGWRTIISVPFMTLFFIFTSKSSEIVSISIRVMKKPILVLGLLLSSVLITLQQWLFVWAPLNEKGLDVSLGYFMLPLVMLLVARFLYGEKLSSIKWVAAGLATVGVVNEVFRVGGFSWVAMTVAFGFTLYFILRRKIGINNLGGLWFDMVLMLPFAIWAVTHNNAHEVDFQALKAGVLVAGVGLISAIAFMAYISACSLLPFSLFGLMGYVEPVLLVLVAFLIGEKLENKEILTYALIWMAVIFLIVDGIKNISSERKNHKKREH